VQARPELSDGFKEREIACLEDTSGFHVAWIIHIYVYAAHRLWDTDTASKFAVRLDAVSSRLLLRLKRLVVALGEGPRRSAETAAHAPKHWQGRLAHRDIDAYTYNEVDRIACSVQLRPLDSQPLLVNRRGREK
jgi:hypothetical protein